MSEESSKRSRRKPHRSLSDEQISFFYALGANLGLDQANYELPFRSRDDADFLMQDSSVGHQVEMLGAEVFQSFMKTPPETATSVPSVNLGFKRRWEDESELSSAKRMRSNPSINDLANKFLVGPLVFEDTEDPEDEAAEQSARRQRRALPMSNIMPADDGPMADPFGEVSITASIPSAPLRLGEEEWLSEEHIDGDLGHLTGELRRDYPELARETRIVPVQAASRLQNLGGEFEALAYSLRSRLYAREAGEGEVRYLLLPVSDGGDSAGSHWSLLFVDRQAPGGPVADHYDSAGQRNRAAAEQLARRLGATCRDGEMAQQSNGYDCGIFVLAAARELVVRLLGEEEPNLDLRGVTAHRREVRDRLGHRPETGGREEREDLSMIDPALLTQEQLRARTGATAMDLDDESDEDSLFGAGNDEPDIEAPPELALPGGAANWVPPPNFERVVEDLQALNERPDAGPDVEPDEGEVDFLLEMTPEQSQLLEQCIAKGWTAADVYSVAAELGIAEAIVRHIRKMAYTKKRTAKVIEASEAVKQEMAKLGLTTEKHQNLKGGAKYAKKLKETDEYKTLTVETASYLSGATVSNLKREAIFMKER